MKIPVVIRGSKIIGYACYADITRFFRHGFVLVKIDR